MGGVLVTGGAGVMGRRLVERLQARGHWIRILTLPGDKGAKALEDLAEIVYGDITSPATLRGMMAGIDTVYHLAAIILSPLDTKLFWKVNYAGTRHVVDEAEKAGVEHLIYVSSASAGYRRPLPYARSKLAAENLVMQSRVPHWTLARPTLVYEDGGAAEFMHFVDYLKRYPIIPFIGPGLSRKSPVHALDLVGALASMAGNPKAYGKLYHLSGREILTLKQLAQLLLEHMGKPKPFVHLPVGLCRALIPAAYLVSRVTGKQPLLTPQTVSGMVEDAIGDPRPAMQDLGYDPRGFREGLSTLTSLKGCLAR